MKLDRPMLCCTLLSAFLLHTGIQIEVRNHLAGGMLPNQEGGKLRYQPGEDEAVWGQVQNDASLESGRPLTEAEQAQFHQDRIAAQRHNAVVDWTRGMGTLQYFLLPLAIMWSVLLLGSRMRKARLLALLCVLTNILCAASMFYRGYFND